MYDTYRLMNSFKRESIEKQELEELVIKFNEGLDKKVISNYFACIYCKVFPAILKIQKSFITLTNEQKVEESLFTLYRSITKYKKESKIKFCTYFYGNYKRALITLTDQQNCLNRRVWNNMILSSEKANRALENNQSNKVDYFDYLKELQQNDLLSCEEKLFCKSILTGFTSCRQIIDNMNIVNIDLFDCKRNKAITNPLTENQLKNRYVKVRESIRNKIRNGCL